MIAMYMLQNIKLCAHEDSELLVFIYNMFFFMLDANV